MSMQEALTCGQLIFTDWDWHWANWQGRYKNAVVEKLSL